MRGGKPASGARSLPRQHPGTSTLLVRKTQGSLVIKMGSVQQNG